MSLPVWADLVISRGVENHSFQNNDALDPFLPQGRTPEPMIKRKGTRTGGILKGAPVFSGGETKRDGGTGSICRSLADNIGGLYLVGVSVRRVGDKVVPLSTTAPVPQQLHKSHRYVGSWLHPG